MIYAKAPTRNAEQVKQALARLKLLDTHRYVQHSPSYVYFPVNISDAKVKKLIESCGAERVMRKEATGSGKMALRSMPKPKLTSNELKSLEKGFDLFGDIALIEAPRGSKDKEKTIANAILKANPRIKTVLAKAGPISGIYRTRKLRFVAGHKNFVALHKENGCIFKVDLRKVFFSSRFAFERNRIVSLVSERERVMVMFAGVGPFAIEIAKAHKKTKVVGIELNRRGYEYMVENIKLNKTENVLPVLGDVRVAAKDFHGFADRIIMPMPKTSYKFLDEAFAVARKNAFVNIYSFSTIENQFNSIKDEIREHAKEHGYKVKFIFGRVVRPYSAKEAEVVLDYKITK